MFLSPIYACREYPILGRINIVFYEFGSFREHFILQYGNAYGNEA